jgi:hypothetical protein
VKTTEIVVFDSRVLNYNIGELMKDMDELLDDISPEGKDKTNFTGGYVQQLKNSNRFTAFFGTKAGTTNKATVQIDIPDDEVDLMYLMLKAKIHQMKNIRQKVKKVSLAERRLKKYSKEIEAEIIDPDLISDNYER